MHKQNAKCHYKAHSNWLWAQTNSGTAFCHLGVLGHAEGQWQQSNSNCQRLLNWVQLLENSVTVDFLPGTHRFVVICSCTLDVSAHLGAGEEAGGGDFVFRGLGSRLLVIVGKKNSPSSIFRLHSWLKPRYNSYSYFFFLLPCHCLHFVEKKEEHFRSKIEPLWLPRWQVVLVVW